jgi:hypothetical protein
VPRRRRQEHASDAEEQVLGDGAAIRQAKRAVPCDSSGEDGVEDRAGDEQEVIHDRA